MKATVLFRIASVLTVIFAAGHTFGFWQLSPSWGITDALVSIKSTHFKSQGFDRTFWDFYFGFGLFTTLFFLLCAYLAWYIGGMARNDWASMKSLAWVLTGAFAVVLLLTTRYFFTAPVIFSSVIFMILLAGCLVADRAAAFR